MFSATRAESRLTASDAVLTARICALSESLAKLVSGLGPGTEELSQAALFLQSRAHAGAEGGATVLPANSALVRLQRGLGLAPIERDLLVLAGLPEAHEGFASVLRQLHPHGEARPTVGLAARLFCESDAERQKLRELLELGVTARSGLVSMSSSERPFFERSLLPANAIWSVLDGVDTWPDTLPPLECSPVRAGLQGWLKSSQVQRARSVLSAGEATLILVTARNDQVALERSLALVAEAQVPYVALTWPALSREQTRAAEGLLGVHCTARAVVPVLHLERSEEAQTLTLPAVPHWRGPVIVCTSAGSLVMPHSRAVLAVSIEALKPAERAQAWRELMPQLTQQAGLLSSRYTLEPAALARVANDIDFEAEQRPERLLTRVAESIRVRSIRTLGAGVHLLGARARWNDLVLAPEQRAQIEEAVDRLVFQSKVVDEWGLLARKRGARGVKMLLAGPSGTGKSLSAEVLASRLGADLLMVDLSRVVSKWIGETEKNLAQVFEAAEQTQAVLVFDEADALFGKRTDVSDARDRYANLETAYLLTRLESFDGLAILSTNLRQNIDSAFTRRLEFIIDYHEPNVAQREELWRVHLPTTVPLHSRVDFRQLAELYAIVGGAIRNASVAAAFMAAADGGAVTLEHLVKAIRREYQKSGRAFPGYPPGVN